MKRIEPKAVNFDHIARAYRWMEYLSLGRRLERVRLHFLPHLEVGRDIQARALVLGDGDGRFAARLLTVCPKLTADVVDLSPAMLALLEQRCLRAGGGARQRLTLHVLDALEFTRGGVCAHSYDLVVTHFFLDCLTQEEVAQLVGQVLPALAPGALWLVSEFRIPGGLLHWPAKLYVRALYLAFRLLTGLRTTHLPDYATAFEQAGLTNIATHRALLGLLTTELWRMPWEPDGAIAPSRRYADDASRADAGFLASPE